MRQSGLTGASSRGGVAITFAPNITVYASDGRDFGKKLNEYVRQTGARELRKALGMN